ncbi:MAG: peptide ABC transporter substrate-binding protein [Anaerolineae bacterium]|nr:peptide ABC transporter substrate-binding protein [Gloeobacterales cyanobacterium ES-bin-313]
MRVKRNFICSLLAGLSVVNLTACSQPDEQYFGKLDTPKENILRVGNGAEPRSFDPHKSIAYAEGHIYLNIFESLTSRDPKTLEAMPALATGWESKDDARTWVFHLRKGATFTDGKAITAQDFVWSWQRLVNPANASPYVFAALPIKNAQAVFDGKLPLSQLGVRALDDNTLEVNLEQPTPIFPKLASAWAFVALPRHVIERYGDAWSRPEHLVSNGPFQVADYRPYDQVVLTKSPTYWDHDQVRLDKIVLLPVSDQSQNTNLYRAGELDIVRNLYLPDALIPALSKRKDFRSGSFFGAYYLEFNVKHKPFDDIRVRRALNLAIDREAITSRYLKVLNMQPACSVVPPILSGYSAPRCTMYNPKRARALLVEAGYPGGKNFPAVSIDIINHGTTITASQAIQRMWKEQLGIHVNIQMEESQTHMARAESRNFSILSGGWIGDYMDPAAFLDLYIDTNSNNHTDWKDSEYIALMKKAEGAADIKQRLYWMHAAEARLIDQAPLAPLVFMGTQSMQKPWVKGLYANPLGQNSFKSVWIDHRWQRESVIATKVKP